MPEGSPPCVCADIPVRLKAVKKNGQYAPASTDPAALLSKRLSCSLKLPQAAVQSEVCVKQKGKPRPKGLSLQGKLKAQY
jgi:hypothetical protein